MNDACGNRIIGPTIWTDDGRCAVCGYVPRVGNRSTPESKRNWFWWCRVRHEQSHQRPRRTRQKIGCGRGRRGQS